MSKIYRSAKGIPVNMEELRTNNEDRIASGNMNVNARGDRLGKGGEVVQTVADLARTAQARMKKTSVKASVKAPIEEEIVKLPEAEEQFVSSTEEVMDEEGNITVQKKDTKKKSSPKKES